MTDSLSGLFRDIARLHVRAQRAAIACRDTSETHCIILTEIGRGDAMSITELASRLQLDKGWVSRAVDQLVREGLVARTSREDDRRLVELTLTASGRRHFRDVELCLNSQVDRVFARLSGSDRKRVAEALRLLHSAYVEESASNRRVNRKAAAA